MNDEDRQILAELRSKLPVDPYNLEEENGYQPVLYDQVGQWVSGIKAASKTAKEHIEYVKADLSLKIRRNPKEYGLDEKPKEGAISAAITTHPDYREAFSDYIEADKLASEASVLLSSTEQRKSSISNLVRLFVRAYYSSSSPVSAEDWREDEQAIIAARNRKADEDAFAQEDHEQDMEEI